MTELGLGMTDEAETAVSRAVISAKITSYGRTSGAVYIKRISTGADNNPFCRLYASRMRLLRRFRFTARLKSRFGTDTTIRVASARVRLAMPEGNWFFGHCPEK